MMGRPAYFEAIRQKTADRWRQLQDPELAGPWHQLFQQVQSPRHILSELLQNADDAGATEASVKIDNQVFIFEHNGEDFTEEHFASLCRFGYSNKRALHTIGFRGIGFKSTFSLGDRVELFTPSLSVCFHRQRFTEPEWISSPPDTNGRTRIHVGITKPLAQREVERNLGEWIDSPFSLLFFKNIRKIVIGGKEVHWGSLGPGPIPESEWMALYEKENEAFLLIHSEPEMFPEAALVEIRNQRMLSNEEETDFPPCKVEIVLGVTGQFYVVLPTGVETKLPFACNAPFIQDPARLKIVNPETSPTNRWLLERAGRLAASSMIQWLGQGDMPMAERSQAYGLFPDNGSEGNSLESVCGKIVQEAFIKAIEGKKFLLTADGQLVPKKQGVIIPREILETWPAEQATSLLDSKCRPAFCPSVEAADQQKLLRWDVVDEIDRQRILSILQQKYFPKPKTWRQLLTLWAYLAPVVTGYRNYANAKDIRIVPVQGKEVLYAASEVVRLGEKKLLQSKDDWVFLANYLVVLNQNWPNFLAEQRRATSHQNDTSAKDEVEGANAVLEKIGLGETSDVNKIIDRVITGFFSQERCSITDCVHLAQIAAKLNATISDGFRYVTRDKSLRACDNITYYDYDGELEGLLPDSRRDSQLLHQDYARAFTSCSQQDWEKWIASGRARLLTFIPLLRKPIHIYGKREIQQEAFKRGHQAELTYPYVTYNFVLEDWDFENTVWRHWMVLASDDEGLWARLIDSVLAQRETYWVRAKSARLFQVATTHKLRMITTGPLLPSWVLRLKELPCILDTRGFHRKPEDLLRRTPLTESLLDVENFVHARIDNEAARPLLDLLGVRSTPTGPDRLLDRLRALAKAEKPPTHEVERWYRRLDQMVDSCSTADLHTIRQALQSERLILTHDGAWTSASGVFLFSSDDDVPGAAVIRPSVNDLALWQKVGVAERPTADLAISWLKKLASGSTPSPEDARRLRALLGRYPLRIWSECGHWLNLADEWVPIATLAYGLTMQSLVKYGHLHKWVKQKTADFRPLRGEITCDPPFSQLPSLAAQIQERFQSKPFSNAQLIKKDWLRALSSQLIRVKFDSEEETVRVRALAGRLSRTSWMESSELELIPYINDIPAGTKRQADVIWLDDCLYVEPQPTAKLARRVPEEIGKEFARPDIKSALDYSFERPSQDVRDYFEQNFSLATMPTPPVEPPVSSEGVTTATTDTSATRQPEADVPGEPGMPDDDVVEPVEPEAAEPAGSSSGESESEQPTTEPRERPDPRQRHAPRPATPSFMERFARDRGFHKNGEDRFCHENGEWIAKTHGEAFPWEHHTANDVRYYWPKDHCLEHEPLQIEAHVWWLIETRPDNYALILSSPQGTPIEVTGARLRIMCNEGKITLHPATYRLVYDHNRQ